MKKQDGSNLNSLLVIGNGFDLHCGLRSTFSDYYNSICLDNNEFLYLLYEDGKYEEMESYLKEHSSSINFWSLLFYIQYYSDKTIYKISDNKSTNWFDIEQLIKMSFNRVFDGGESLEYFISRAFYHLKHNSHIRSDKGYEIRKNPYMLFPFLEGKIYDNPIYYLLDELHKFENSFKDYIHNEQQKLSYKEATFSLLNKFVDNKKENICVLNFNYTIIDDNELIKNQINIHGNINENEIILGIDSNEVDKEEYNCFTKTYRDLHKVKEIIELPEEVNKIYFYGHSLATADFSYFYSLFDMYKLYDGSLMLIFLYSDYAKTDSDNEHNHNIYINRIYELINKYSKTSRGENNLLHRLLLEGRILVKKI